MVHEQLRRFRSTDAVTDVVGSIIMLSITIVVFAGVSAAVISQVADGDGAAPASFRFETVDGAVLLHHLGGPPIQLSSLSIIVEEPTRSTLAGTSLSPFSGQSTWAIGESLCVAGPAPSCLKTSVTAAAVVVDNNILALHGSLGGAA